MDDLLKTKDLKFRLNPLVSLCLLFRNTLSSYSRLSRRTCSKSNLKKPFQYSVKPLLKSFFSEFILLVYPGVLLAISPSGGVLHTWEASSSSLEFSLVLALY